MGKAKLEIGLIHLIIIWTASIFQGCAITANETDKALVLTELTD